MRAEEQTTEIVPIHPDLARIIQRDREAVAQGYQEGDVNHYVNPIIGMLRIRLHHCEPVRTVDIEWAVEALTKAANAEIALLAYLRPNQYEHAHAPVDPPRKPPVSPAANEPTA